MTKPIKITLIAAAMASLSTTVPAHAQDKGGDRVNMVIAYDESECPQQAAENEIVICEILVEAERYRIPSNLRTSSSPENVSQVRKVESYRYIGDFGTMSCSPAGAGGFTGCTQKFIDAAYAEREQGEAVRFGQLIEQARQERLSTIDADAAAEQERVEQIEQEYLRRLEQERDAPIPGEDDPSLTPPPIDTEARQPPAEPEKQGPFDDGDEEQVPLDAIPPAEAPGAA